MVSGDITENSYSAPELVEYGEVKQLTESVYVDDVGGDIIDS